jgi:hypothetical protein
MSEKSKYLSKIKKLLRLANGTSSPEEAANAMSKAQAYMREYGLSQNDVELAVINEASSRGAPSDAQKVPVYLSRLCHLICRAFGVEAYFAGEWRSSGTLKRVVQFYGPGERPEVAAYAFDVLTRQLKQARKQYQDKHCKRCKSATRIARGDQFCEGWVGGAAGVIKAFTLTPDEKGLMERYDEEITRKLNLQTTPTRQAKACHGSDNAVNAGYIEGKNARLHHGVDGNQQLAIGRQ